MLSVLNYITWNVSPWIYEGEYFVIEWYGALWTLGLIGILVVLLLTFKHDKVPMNYALVCFMVMLVCVIFFGHLFQGLFYEWYYTSNNPIHLFGTDWHYRNYYIEEPVLFITFTHGGFSSHGTVLGMIFAGWIMGKIMEADTWYCADRGMIGLCLLGITVRTANFINNEICGIATTSPGGVIFGENTNAAYPTQLYEIISYLIAASIAVWMFMHKNGGQYRGLISALIMGLVMSFRFFIEYIKLPQMEIEQTWLLNMGQLLSIPFVILSVWLAQSSLKHGIVGECVLPTLTRAERRRIRKGIE